MPSRYYGRRSSAGSGGSQDTDPQLSLISPLETVQLDGRNSAPSARSRSTDSSTTAYSTAPVSPPRYMSNNSISLPPTLTEEAPPAATLHRTNPPTVQTGPEGLSEQRFGSGVIPPGPLSSIILGSPPRPLRSTLLPPPNHPGRLSWSRVYHGVVFNVPAPNSEARAPFYCVTKGTHLGVFETWPETASYVKRVKGAVQCKVATIDDGIRMFEDTIDVGGVELLYR
ncbi:hypothetical protein HYDPIDRAFT_116110 [Hydnomerulius pinastri MD-312]|uniref:Ribonuclease H1 N-terminal domain-containing protein n=1 Tax=Hydnomerulius pinastri MD-312 TaxID=994086 RepID=A0A0C9V6U3_9AGAM|nr:hypothetical protein HYDPIDRAFT_116110 [Hydnomerulius pinastri MD-312]